MEKNHNSENSRHTDEQLDREIREGALEPGLGEHDRRLYGELFSALADAPVPSLPPDFARKVSAKALAARRRRSLVNSLVLYGGLILVTLAGSALCLYFISTESFSRIAGLLGQYKTPILFALGVLAAIQAIDQFLIEPKRGYIPGNP
jgi:hypothetical protein